MHIHIKNEKLEQDGPIHPLSKENLKELSLAEKILIKGENLQGLNALISAGFSGRIDLIYIDPPFATNSKFSKGETRTSTISSSRSDELAYEDKLLGNDFIEFLRKRLLLIRTLMSESASIYLHTDYKIGHYVKVMMDEIFGIENFRNDITRIKCNPKNFSRNAYGNIKDMILFYTKSSSAIWNNPTDTIEEIELEKRFNKVDSNGRKYTTIPVHAPGETKNGPTGEPWRGMLPPKGRHWRCSPLELDKLDQDGLIEWSKTGNPRKIVYAEDKLKSGKKKQDIWEYKDYQYPQYPTEKNIEMVEEIVKASSNDDSIVLDCFCGSGTTLIAAEKLNRKWIGIDSSDVAIKTAETRLSKYRDTDLFSLASKPYTKVVF